MVFTLHLGEKYTYTSWKSCCLGVNKLLSSSCCILGQNLSWSVFLKKLAKAIDFEAQIKWVFVVKRKLHFQADLVCVSRIHEEKAEPKYNLVIHFTCMCWIRLSLTAYKLDFGVQTIVTRKTMTNFDSRECSERDKCKLYRTCMKSFTWNIVESAATSNLTHTTKIIQKKNNNLKQHTILFNFKGFWSNSEEVNSKNLTLFYYKCFHNKV